jgi:DNA-binding Xre family transcriptional regulator/fido (protein-threonine AMPylation protein)
MYSYQGLNKILKQRGLKKSELTKLLGISSRTIAKIGKGEKLADNVLNKLCDFFGCTQIELVQKVCVNPVLQVLREEKAAKLSGGLYHETQVRLTYNSSRIEGSKLSEDQTRLIFETNTIGTTEDLSVDDIIETANHFRAIDYVIDHAEDELSETFIKELHRILKTGTKDSFISWFNVGDYKTKANTVGGKATILPKQVPDAMKKLLAEYNCTKASLKDIVAFHYEFESIHPFQDGNGRVGRLIAFKECLKNNIVPFIIEDRKKSFYYRGLKEWNNEKGFLIDTCLDGQDTYKAILDYFGIKY